MIVLSEELTDVEHFQDYKLGSRVALQDHLNNGEKLYGTVERQRKDGMYRYIYKETSRYEQLTLKFLKRLQNF